MYIRLRAVLFIALFLASSTLFAEKKLVIFDTDLAGDIDDAFAHALVQISPEIELLGITIADGPTARRAAVSCRMLYICGQKNIPVYVGRPTRQGKVGGDAPQLEWGTGFRDYQPQEKSAADFIIETLKKYPGQVTIISVGPVTNLADAIDQGPRAWKLVKEVYSMFGSFDLGYNSNPIPSAEWNVYADIPSAQKFIASGVPITLAGLDVTTMVKFEQGRRQQLLLRNSPLTNALCALYSLWSLDSPGRDPILYDPVAVVMSFNDKFVSKRQVHVRVTDKGYTIVDESKKPNCNIGVNIRADDFLDWLTSRLLKQNLMR